MPRGLRDDGSIFEIPVNRSYRDNQAEITGGAGSLGVVRDEECDVARRDIVITARDHARARRRYPRRLLSREASIFTDYDYIAYRQILF